WTATGMRPGPTATAAAGSSPGWSPRAAVEPTPSWPDPLAPQQWIVLSSSSAHAYDCPASMATGVRPAPNGTAGAGSSPGWSPRSSTDPTPSAPEALAPQQWTVPLSSAAQVWLPPLAIATAVRPAPSGTAAVGSSPGSSPRLSVVPRPSWPALFRPQQWTVPSSSNAHVW